MIPVTTFAGKKVAVFGLGGSGLVSASALLAGGADVVAFDDDAQSVAKANAAGIPTADLHSIDWSRIAALVLAPGVPLTHPAPHWVAELARKAGDRSDRRHRAVLPRAPKPGAGCALRRHHRHQRQIDDDGAHRPSRGFGRNGRAAWRQYRHRDPVAGAAARRPGPTGARSRHRVLFLSDRSRAHARSLGRHPDQSQRRSSRSPRHHGALRGGQGAPRRRRAEGRHRDRRRR